MDINKVVHICQVWNSIFAAWWLLQHHRGKKPFWTQIKFIVTLSGKLKKQVYFSFWKDQSEDQLINNTGTPAYMNLVKNIGSFIE